MTHGPQRYVATVRIDIRQEPYIGGTLTVQEEITVHADGFMALCGILAQFDALARKMDEGKH